MQKTNLFVAAVGARFSVERDCWVGENLANPGLRSETWGTRSSGGAEGCAISRVAVRA
jgi:hypothetical protein